MTKREAATETNRGTVIVWFVNADFLLVLNIIDETKICSKI